MKLNRLILLFLSGMVFSVITSVAFGLYSSGKVLFPEDNSQTEVLQACQATPRDIMIVMDTSNSMENGKLGYAKNAAQNLLNILAQRGSTSRVGIASFDEEHGKVNQHLSNNYTAVSESLWRLNHKGTNGTCLECALLDTKTQNDVYREFQNNSWYPSKAIIILTDGNINRHIKNTNPNKGDVVGGNISNSEGQGLTALNTVKNAFAPSVWAVHYGSSNVGYVQGFPSGQGQYIPANSETLSNAFTIIANTIHPYCPPPTATPTSTPTPTPIPFGSISGSVFLDYNLDGDLDKGEPQASVPVSIQLSYSKQSVHTGTFSFTNLPIRTYTLRLVTPDGYRMTSPDVYTITLGANGSCSVTPTQNGTACNLANLSNLRFGITDTLPWFQTTDGSLLQTLSGIQNRIPVSSVCSRYTIASNPGTLYSGTAANAFGSSFLSQRNWIVTGSSVPTGNASTLSYNALLATLKANKETIEQLSCAGSGCSITNSTIMSGAYQRNGNLTLQTVNLTNKSVILLINGDVRINGQITAAPGAFFLLAATGNITVSPTIGNTSRSCIGTATPHLQGIFVTNQHVILENAGSCPNADRQLHIAGNVVTNADKVNGGSIENRKTLCSEDRYYPTFTLQPRNDFLLNAPESIMRQDISWKEVTP